MVLECGTIFSGVDLSFLPCFLHARRRLYGDTMASESNDRYVAVHRKTRTVYPKEGVFDSVDAAAEFALRREPNRLAWTFGKVAAHDQRRRSTALSSSDKTRVRKLWSAHMVSEEPSVDLVKSLPASPRVPHDAKKIRRVSTVPAKPQTVPPAVHTTTTPAIAPPPPSEDSELPKWEPTAFDPDAAEDEPKPRRRRRKFN